MPKGPINQNEIFASDFLGTGMNADTLDGLDANSFLRRDDHALPSTTNTFDLGNITFQWRNIYAQNINGVITNNFMRKDSHNNPTINSNGITGFNIGSPSAYWLGMYSRKGYFDEVYCNTLNRLDGEKFSHHDLSFIGTFTHEQIDSHINSTIEVHGATPQLAGNKIVSRDSNGDIWVRVVHGHATTAGYADLAEKYTCSLNNITEGTVMSVCSSGSYEVEVCLDELSHKYVGIISKNPAFIMNNNENGVIVGLKGKLPVRIIGSIDKGDIIVSAGNGTARKMKNNNEYIYKIGYSLETNNSSKEKLVMCLIV